jgi:phosphatidylinositol alpha-mannosyltransferase
MTGAANGRLRVALVYDDSLDRNGGVTQYLTLLGRGLARAGHEVAYFVGASRLDCLEQAPVHSLARNIRVRFNGSSGTVPVWSTRRDITAALASLRPDVVHVQIPYSPFMSARVIGQLESTTALVGSFHVNSERALPRAGSRLLASVTQRSLRRFDRIVAVSDVAARFAARWFGINGLDVVPAMVDVAATRRMATTAGHERCSASGPRLVFIGNLVPRKRIDTLIAAFPAIVAHNPGATLTIAGDGHLRRRLEQQVRRSRLGGAVRFLGTVDESEKALLLANAHVACFPSAYGESFGIVLLEAIAAGAGVVVGARNAAYAEVLAATPAVLSVPGDPTDLARMIVRLVSDDRLRSQVHASQQVVAARHDVAVVTATLLAVYEEALGRRTSSPASESRAGGTIGALA